MPVAPAPWIRMPLSALPARYRTAIVLCELEGVSRREAARRLRLSEGTLSSRLARGRQLLRRRLLSRDAGWDPLYQAGRGPVAAISIDEVWSGLRFGLRPDLTG